MRQTFISILTSLLFLGCSSIVPISQRGIGGGAGEYHVSGRKIETPEQPSDVYVKRSTQRIERKDAPSRTGSLYREGNAANYLAGEAPLEPGRAVIVKVAAKAGSSAPAPGEGGQSGPAQAPASGGESAGADLDAIIKSLPNLDAGSANPTVLKQFKMIVTRVLDNGDFEGMYRRGSQSGDESNSLEVRARIPQDAVVTKGEVTTGDLADVTYFENQDGQLMSRESSEWEDEYTLRMSGFTEAKSQAAQDLEAKRKQLDDARKQVQTKVQTMGAERRQVAKEREALAKEKAEVDQKMKQMTQEMETLKATVNEQEARLKENENAGAGDASDQAAASESKKGGSGGQ